MTNLEIKIGDENDYDNGYADYSDDVVFDDDNDDCAGLAWRSPSRETRRGRRCSRRWTRTATVLSHSTSGSPSALPRSSPRFKVIAHLQFQLLVIKQGNLFFFLSIYCIQHCFICRPLDSTVSEDAGIEPRTSVLAVRRSNH
jgi:hypothetical protein